MNYIPDSYERANRAYGSLIPCVRRWIAGEPILIVEGKGAVLKDSTGKEYLDLFCSHGTTAMIGYNHPTVMEALRHQIERLYALSAEFANIPAMVAAGGVAETLLYRDEQHAFYNDGKKMYYPTMVACSEFLSRVFGLGIYPPALEGYELWAAGWGTDQAAVTLSDPRTAAWVANMLESAGYSVRLAEDGDPSDSHLWDTEPTEQSLQTARAYAHGNGKRRIIVLGSGDTEWLGLGAVVVEDAANRAAIHAAVLEATPVQP